MQHRIAQVDYSLLQWQSDQLLCSRCLRAGVRKPVVQLLSPRHRPRSLCGKAGAAASRAATDSSRPWV